MTRHESARVIEDGLSRDLAEHIASWIVSGDRRERAWVVGVYGARGVGKTSLLLTLLEVLRERNQTAVRLALPTASEDDLDPANLLKPAALRDGDELVFELLRHLEKMYEHRHFADGKGPFASAREIEVQRMDIGRFLEYAREVGASHEDLTQRTIGIHAEVASSTVKLKKAFGEIIRELRCPEESRRSEEKTLVLLVDDLDLHPERALELLEIFHIFLDQPGVVIVLAADKPLLLTGIQRGLKKRRKLRQYPGLAAALLAKYVPYEWHIAIPTEDERLQLLWPDDDSETEPPEHELWRWWPTDEQVEARTFKGPGG